MPRLLRVLAVLFLVPVVIFSTPYTASAATSGTLVYTMTLGADVPARCQITWARTTTGISIGAASRCDAGPDLTPYSCQPVEGDCGMYGMVFKSVSGDTCGSAPLPARDVEGNDVRSVAAGLGAAFAPVSWQNCVPVTACLSYYFEGVGGLLDVDTAACSAFPVDPPEPGWQPPAEMLFGDCPLGNATGATWDHAQTYVDAQFKVYVKDKMRLLLDYREPAGQSWSLAEREWRLNVIHSVAGTPPTPANAPAAGLQIPAGSNSQPLTTDDTSNGQNPVWVHDELWMNNPSGLGSSHLEEDPPKMAYGVQVTTKGPLSTANIPIGYTNPSKCTFWLGPKIRVSNHPQWGYAEPWGEMLMEDDYETDPVEPTPPTEVEPEPIDPGTDLGLLGAILAVLRSLWNAIKGIAAAIGDVLERLFIPDKGFMDEAFRDLRDAWADTTVAKFGDVFDSSLLDPNVAGCSGLRLSFELPGDVIVDERLGAACSGNMENAANIVRSVITATLFVGGGIACLRGIGAGFGWRPSIGRSVDS